MIDDETLLQKANMGDENAENTLLERYKSLVVKIARGYFILGWEMEDIVQEGMIGLYKAIKGYNKSKNTTFKTFATMCIKHQIQSAIKRQTRRKTRHLQIRFRFKVFQKIRMMTTFSLSTLSFRFRLMRR